MSAQEAVRHIFDRQAPYRSCATAALHAVLPFPPSQRAVEAVYYNYSSMDHLAVVVLRELAQRHLLTSIPT